ncbi:hypothetical protein HF1_08910 [Mycoplasma haemofelis str. Langford 1]|uniref:Lipoprotein n=1 Tax=Mycoplasma haemofelis (strain Langford 1) TaxID=941640 RepID=E8ZIC8_MYCHL|nr:hypothetical protein [Mycoplasma haemofelis]CBY92899.1 hypothetical protein HF1_08910 [Mycoplasma haemofelis str. Langford 1]
MSKLLLPALGLGGASAAAAGGYALFSGRDNPSLPQEETFRTKYAKAILQDSDNLWDSKFTSLEQGNQHTHPKLAQAKTQSSSNKETAKALHKQACQEIYNSKVEGTTYLSDFQSYCSKNFKDAIISSKKWVTDENTKKEKWDPKLTALKTHDTNQKGELDGSLSSLKETLSKVSNSSWEDSHRQSLKQWCDESRKAIFMGEEDKKFIQVGLYCIES